MTDWTRPDRHQFGGLFDALQSDLDDLRMGILDRSRSDGRRWSLTAEQLFDRAIAQPRKAVAPSEGGSGRGGYAADGSKPGPTPSAALTVDSEEVVRLRELVTHVRTALLCLDDAVKALDKATPDQQRPDRPDLNACRVCSRPGKPEPVYRSERCRWCYDFWILWKLDTPPAILKMRREGKRISEQAIRAELDEEAMAG